MVAIACGGGVDERSDQADQAAVTAAQCERIRTETRFPVSLVGVDDTDIPWSFPYKAAATCVTRVMSDRGDAFADDWNPDNPPRVWFGTPDPTICDGIPTCFDPRDIIGWAPPGGHKGVSGLAIAECPAVLVYNGDKSNDLLAPDERAPPDAYFNHSLRIAEHEFIHIALNLASGWTLSEESANHTHPAFKDKILGGCQALFGSP